MALRTGMIFDKVYECLKKRFDDGAVDSPLQFKYISQVKILMNTVGAWPNKQFAKERLGTMLSVYNLFLIPFGIHLFISGSFYIRQNFKIMTFFDMGHELLCTFFGILFVQRLITARTKKYQETIKDYLSEFHLFFYKDMSTYAAQVHDQIHIISGVFTIYIMAQVPIGISLFNFMPWYNNYSRGMFGEKPPENKTFEHAVYYYLPDAVYTTKKGYWILFTLNIPITYITTIGICWFDLLLSLIVLQIWGHLKILNHNLLRLPLPVNSILYSEDENNVINNWLKDNIDHHNVIVKFVDRCSDAFSEYLFVFYLLMQIITCILTLEISSFTADSLAKYGPLTLNMYLQLIYVSILFEMLNTKSEQLIDAVYAMPWEHMDSTNRKIMMFFLQRVQTPVSLKAAKVVPVGVRTMSSVIKTTCSCYMMLKAFAGEQE